MQHWEKWATLEISKVVFNFNIDIQLFIKACIFPSTNLSLILFSNYEQFTLVTILQQKPYKVLLIVNIVTSYEPKTIQHIFITNKILPILGSKKTQYFQFLEVKMSKQLNMKKWKQNWNFIMISNWSIF